MKFKRQKKQLSLVEKLEAKGYDIIKAEDIIIARYGRSRLLLITEEKLQFRDDYLFVQNLSKEDLLSSKVI